MSNKIVELRNARAALAAAEAQLAALQDDPELKRLQRFEDELRALMANHGRSLIDINQILDPNYKAPRQTTAQGQGQTTGKALVQVWKNPHNNEEVRATHGNHKVLNEWRKKWGADAVKKWKKPAA